MDVLEFRKLYWNYYLQLESDFFSYSPYCEIDTANDNAFSIKYLQLLLSVCGEIDSICKTFCKTQDDHFNSEKAGMSDYIPVLLQSYPTFAGETVQVLEHRYREIRPWKSITKGYIPNWWSRYNAVKHHRDEKENYKYANQKNTIEALSALYVLIEYWAAQNFVPCKEKVFSHKDTAFYDRTLQHLKSSRLYLPNWNFYYTLLGEEPWFNPKAYYQYLEEGAQP